MLSYSWVFKYLLFCVVSFLNSRNVELVKKKDQCQKCVVFVDALAELLLFPLFAVMISLSTLLEGCTVSFFYDVTLLT